MLYHADRSLFLQGTLSVVERTQQFLNAIEQRRNLNAYLHVLHDQALHQAAEADERFAANLARPLEGMVVAVKDNISMKGARLTCASRILENFEPVFNATVIERLQDAGAIVIGKTNMDEFAMGSSNETSAFGPVLHPLDPHRVPGGSSGGSAVAVAAGTCHVSLGSDTGGSVRQPAALCGVLGLKPTYGAVSRYGLVAFASSLDQIGVFAHDAVDAASVLSVISGFDPFDATSHHSAWLPTMSGPLRIGRISDDLLSDCTEAIRESYERYIAHLEGIGHTIVPVTLPLSEIWIPTYFILATAEASSNLSRFDGVRFGLRIDGAEDVDMITATRSVGFGAEVKRRIMLGTYVLSSGYADQYYHKAQKARTAITKAYASVFHQVHLLAMPTTPTTAFKRGEITDPVQMWLSDLFTVSANIAGIPALSLPYGTDAQSLPIGIQLQGPHWSDQWLLDFANAHHTLQ